MNRTLTLAAVLVVFAAAATSRAQQAPDLGYAFPPVVVPGTVADVQLGGYDFTSDMQFFALDGSLKIEPQGPPGEFLVPKPPYWFGPKSRSTAFPISRELPARITVPADQSPGLVAWQVASANGTSSTAMIYVSNSREVVERRDRDHPQLFDSLPLAVSGRLQRIAEVDRYRITARRDGPISIDLFARRLGSNFNGVIEVRGPDGRLIRDIADTSGNDIAVTFSAKADTEYEVRLFDVDFRGHPSYVYRLAVSDGPRVITTIPAVGKRGTTQSVQLLGWGVASGAARLETVEREIRFPADPAQPTLQYTLATPHGVAPPIAIPLSDVDESVRTADHSATQPLTVPSGVTGLLDGEHAYSWTGKKGESWRIVAQSRAIGTDLDLAVRILDADGKQLATADDGPSTVDAELEFKAPADGEFRCVVSDGSGMELGRDAVYRLSVTPAAEDFSLSVPQRLNVPTRGKATLTVTAARLGGFAGEIALRIDGLPAGITIPGDAKIPAKKNNVKIQLTASDTAAATAALIQVTGTATINDAEVSRVATGPRGGDLCPRDPGNSVTSSILLATTLKPPFKLLLTDKNRQRAVHRGTTYPAPFTIEREEGFTGDIQMRMAARQGRHRQGIHGPVITVPSDQTKALYPNFMPEWLETDRTTRMVVHGVARVADPTGKLREVTQAADARITMILEGALLKIAHPPIEHTATGGAGFAIPFRISRSPKLPETVRVELVVPSAISACVESQPLELDATRQAGRLQVKTVKDKRLNGRWTLQLRATAMQDGRWPVVSVRDVDVDFD